MLLDRFFPRRIDVFAIIVVPLVAYFHGGGIDGIETAMKAKDISLKIFNGGGSTEILAMISSLAWGLGYFGQPHILVRFISVKSVKELTKARQIAMIWVVISLVGAIAVGITGTAVFASVNELGGDAEKIFIYMIGKLFNPWIGGVLLAAILSAIMSTIDSQLLVSSSTLTEDFYRYIKKDATEKEKIWTGRICIIIIAAVAYVLAMNPSAKVLSMVSYAWAGFGGAFGPAVLITLYFKNMNWKSVFAGMITGTITIILWKQFGYSEYLYEIIPAFIFNGLVTFAAEKIFFRAGNIYAAKN